MEVPTIPPPMTTMFLGVVTVMRSERALVCLERYGAKDTEIGEQIDFSELGGQTALRRGSRLYGASRVTPRLLWFGG